MGFPAILTTFSPWWRRPGTFKELDLDPSVSTAGLGNRVYVDLVRQKEEGVTERQGRDLKAWSQPYLFSLLLLRNVWPYVHDVEHWNS